MMYGGHLVQHGVGEIRGAFLLEIFLVRLSVPQALEFGRRCGHVESAHVHVEEAEQREHVPEGDSRILKNPRERRGTYVSPMRASVVVPCTRLPPQYVAIGGFATAVARIASSDAYFAGA